MSRLLERLYPNWTWRLPSVTQQIALTFDDGPNPTTTPTLLRELERLNIPCTHFVTGNRCAGNETLLREMAALGHDIGNHGYRHVRFTFHSGTYQRETIERTETLIRDAVGQRSRFFRPCHGTFNPWTQAVLKQTGHRGVLWSLMVNDWTEQSELTLWNRIRSGLHSGAILVLHDAHPTTPRVIRMLPRLAEEIDRRGWTFVPLSTALLTPSLLKPL